MNELIEKYVTLNVGDGTTMQAYVAVPDTKETIPGMLVFQEAFGVNAHIRDVTRRIAQQGYYAIAPELFHRSAPPNFEISYTNMNGVAPHLQVMTADTLREDLEVAHQFLERQTEVSAGKIFSIGFCLGGRVSFYASTLLPLQGAVCFYGGDLVAMAGDGVKNIPCPLLLFWGGQDKHITKEKIAQITRQLDEGDKDYTNVVFSKADHAFFCDARQSYHASAATESWALVNAFWKVNG